MANKYLDKYNKNARAADSRFMEGKREWEGRSKAAKAYRESLDSKTLKALSARRNKVWAAATLDSLTEVEEALKKNPEDKAAKKAEEYLLAERDLFEWKSSRLKEGRPEAQDAPLSKKWQRRKKDAESKNKKIKIPAGKRISVSGGGPIPYSQRWKTGGK